MFCDYGCGKKALYSFKNGKHCCSPNALQCSAKRSKISTSIKKAHREGRLPVVFSNPEVRRRAHRSRNKNLNSVDWDSLSFRRKRLKVWEEQEGKCLFCGLKDWRDLPISLELDHIDGDRSNTSRENLRLLCPNCHSQTPGFRRRGDKSARDNKSKALA